MSVSGLNHRLCMNVNQTRKSCDSRGHTGGVTSGSCMRKPQERGPVHSERAPEPVSVTEARSSQPGMQDTTVDRESTQPRLQPQTLSLSRALSAPISSSTSARHGTTHFTLDVSCVTSNTKSNDTSDLASLMHHWTSSALRSAATKRARNTWLSDTTPLFWKSPQSNLNAGLVQKLEVRIHMLAKCQGLWESTNFFSLHVCEVFQNRGVGSTSYVLRVCSVATERSAETPY